MNTKNFILLWLAIFTAVAAVLTIAALVGKNIVKKQLDQASGNPLLQALGL